MNLDEYREEATEIILKEWEARWRGEDFHSWHWGLLRALWREGCDPKDAVPLITRTGLAYGRDSAVLQREVRNSLKRVGEVGEYVAQPWDGVRADPELVESIRNPPKGGSIRYGALSPLAYLVNRVRPEEWVKAAVAPHTVREWLTMTYSASDPVVLSPTRMARVKAKAVREWLLLPDARLQRMAFTAKGPLREIGMFRKNESMVTTREVVVEFDILSRPEQVRAMALLQRKFGKPPRMIVDSGNKSLHAWWRAESRQEKADMIIEAIRHGADRQVLVTECQWVRTPGAAAREGRRPQVVLMRNT